MTADARRQLLFLDVDGTLLSTAGVQLPSTLEDWDATWQNASNPHLATIVPEHDPRLLAMPCDLIWATAWMADANLVIGSSRGGLPASRRSPLRSHRFRPDERRKVAADHLSSAPRASEF